MSDFKKLDAVDFIKALAITSVVIYHFVTIYMQFIPDILRRLGFVLGTGCQAFLVISGFGLYYSQKRRPLSAPRFWLKRLSKVYFPYIIIVIISYYCQNVYLASGVDRFSALMSHVFLYKMFFPQYEVTFGGHLWFISTIIQFYLVFPLLVRIYKKLGTRRFLVLTFTVNVIWAAFTVITGISGERIWNSFFLQFLFEFAAGMAAAEHIDGVAAWFERTSALKLLLLGAAGYALLLVCYFAGGIVGAFGDAPSAAGFIFCALALYKLGIRPLNSFMVKLSSISYEWYLVHYLVLLLCYFEVWAGISSLGEDILYAVGIFILTLAAAAVYHFLWSNFTRLLKKGWTGLTKKMQK